MKRHGPDDPRTLRTLNNLAWTYRTAGNTAEAIALYQQIQDSRNQKLEAENPDVFITLYDMAKAYLAAGDPEQAVSLFERVAVAIEKRKFVHTDAEWIIGELTQGYERLRQLGKAEVWRRKWLAAVLAKYGPKSPSYAQALLQLASNLLAQKKYEAAESLLIQGYQGMKSSEKTQVPDHHGPSPQRQLTEALEKLVQLYDDWGKKHEADKWRKELDETQRKPQTENQSGARNP
jgi:tetratricopeptide (TPR) repeat protein